MIRYLELTNPKSAYRPAHHRLGGSPGQNLAGNCLGLGAE
jgi:hypothetical protein